jgi:hypothetical protein
MTAHINHDLPIAVVSSCEAFGLVPADDDTAITNE